jgi:hypothetical protein
MLRLLPVRLDFVSLKRRQLGPAKMLLCAFRNRLGYTPMNSEDAVGRAL